MAKFSQPKTQKTQNEYSFLKSLSHEVRTPMNAISGISELLLYKITDPKEREYINSLRAATQNLLMAVNNVVDYDDLINGRIRLKKEPVVLNEMIGNVIDMVRINLGDREVMILADINPLLPRVIMSDAGRLKQVLVYFLSGAARIATKGYISLNVDYADEAKKFIRFMVENTEVESPIMKDIVAFMESKLQVIDWEEGGTKIFFDILIEEAETLDLEEDLETDALPAIYLQDAKEVSVMRKAFEALNIEYRVITSASELFLFKQGERPTHLITNEEYYNKLIDVAEFAEMGIKMIVVANPLKDLGDKDLSYVIRRPVFYPELINAINRSNESKEKKILKLENTRILVVDDNAINLKVTARLLEPYGAFVETATGGEEAVRMVNKTKYDLVLMDYMMPDLDGVEATKIIRNSEDEYFKKLPIVALSANMLVESLEQFKECGMNDILPKPIEIRRLESILRKFVAKEKQGVALVQDQEAAHSYLNPDEFEHISIKEGLAYSGDNVRMYMGILNDFYETAPTKGQLMHELLDKEDIGRYTIEIHSMKSLSRTIGAISLGEKAEMLEKYGHRRDFESIIRKHPDFAEELTLVIDELSMVCGKAKPPKRIPILREKVGAALRDLFHAMEKYDYDAADRICEELGRYVYDDMVEESFQKMKKCVENIDYDGTKECALEMLILL